MVVNHHLVGPGFARQGGFPVGPCCAQNPGAAPLRDLDQQKAHAAGCRVHQCGVARFEREGVAREVMRGEALEQKRSGCLGRYAGGNGNELGGGNDGLRGVTAARPGGGNPISNFESGDLGAERGNDPRHFLSEREGKLLLVKPAALVRIDEIHPRGLDANAHLSRARLGNGTVLDPQFFGAAVFTNPDGLHKANLTPVFQKHKFSPRPLPQGRTVHC
jgi:hypothetical protein